MNTTTKVIIGLAAAAAAGAAIGLLLAPEKGSDLRNKIRAGAKDLADNLSALMMTGKELAANIQDTFSERIDDTREVIDVDLKK